MNSVIENNQSYHPANQNSLLYQVDIKSASTDELKLMFHTGLEVTAQYIKDLAEIWRELESRGEDLSELSSSITKYFPLISKNQMTPAAIVKYAGQEVLLRELSYIPIRDQEKIVEAGAVQFVTKNDEDDSFDIDMADLSAMHVRHYSQIFDNGKVRTVEEQKDFIRLQEAKKTIKARAAKPVRKRKVTFNEKRQSLTCAGVEMRYLDVLEALSIASERSVEEIELFLK